MCEIDIITLQDPEHEQDVSEDEEERSRSWQNGVPSRLKPFDANKEEAMAAGHHFKIILGPGQAHVSCGLTHQCHHLPPVHAC